MPWTLTPTAPKWTATDQLRAAVPWLSDSDFDVDRRALWELDHYDEERASCWPVRLYQQDSTGSCLMLHAARGNGNDGGTITLAISDTPKFDVYAKESFAIAQHGRSRRAVDVDWWREEGA